MIYTHYMYYERKEGQVLLALKIASLYQCCILICRCMQNHNDDTIRTSEDASLEKYTSHFIESAVCERELETEKNCNILTPTPMAITAFLSCSPRLLNLGPGGPASLGHGPHSSVFSPTATDQSGT